MIKTSRAAVAQRVREGEKYLASRGVAEVSANAEFLMAEVLGCGRGTVRASGGRWLSDKQNNYFWELIKHRGRRVPLAYVVGYQPFMGCDIKVTPSVLIPRPETEQLVESVIERARRDSALHIVDIGTGSGCVAVALAVQLSNAMIYATEISPAALTIAEENAISNHVARRVRFLHEDLFKPMKTSSPWADIVVTNPPYIPSAELLGLDKEVQREPFLALDGGKDGLNAIRAIVADAPRMLKPGGWIYMEIGAGQAEKVSRVYAHNGFESVEIRKDLSGRDRIAFARRPV